MALTVHPQGTSNFAIPHVICRKNDASSALATFRPFIQGPTCHGLFCHFHSHQNLIASTQHEVHVFCAIARLHSILPCLIGLYDTTKLPNSACIDPVKHKHYWFFGSWVRTLQSFLRPCISTLKYPSLPTAEISTFEDGEETASNLFQRESTSPPTYNSSSHHHTRRRLCHFWRLRLKTSRRLCYPICHSTNAEFVRRDHGLTARYGQPARYGNNVRSRL